MKPADYDAWYETPRGRWIGETEVRLLRAMLRADAGASVLDVGCGTGYFTRALARAGCEVTGLDPDAEAVRFARARAGSRERYVVGDARALPFPDGCFDHAVAITSLCFITEQERALREMARVARGRIALGLLNRHSRLHHRKAGHGAYAGAHWHTVDEVRRLFDRCKVPSVTLRFSIFLPDGGILAKMVEGFVPAIMPLGGFMLAIADWHGKKSIGSSARPRSSAVLD